MYKSKAAILLVPLCILTACGDTLGEQALLGAGAGTAGAVVTEGDPLTGAVIGAAANIAYCRKFPSRC
jgi:hypothetical protein